jgi:hypothetical protein
MLLRVRLELVVICADPSSLSSFVQSVKPHQEFEYPNIQIGQFPKTWPNPPESAAQIDCARSDSGVDPRSFS